MVRVTEIGAMWSIIIKDVPMIEIGNESKHGTYNFMLCNGNVNKSYSER